MLLRVYRKTRPTFINLRSCHHSSRRIRRASARSIGCCSAATSFNKGQISDPYLPCRRRALKRARAGRSRPGGGCGGLGGGTGGCQLLLGLMKTSIITLTTSCLANRRSRSSLSMPRPERGLPPARLAQTSLRPNGGPRCCACQEGGLLFLSKPQR